MWFVWVLVLFLKGGKLGSGHSTGVDWESIISRGDWELGREWAGKLWAELDVELKISCEERNNGNWSRGFKNRMLKRKEDKLMEKNISINKYLFCF